MKKILVFILLFVGHFESFSQRGNRQPMIVTNTPGTPIIRNDDVPLTNQESGTTLKHSKKTANQPQNNNNFKRIIRQTNILPFEDGSLLTNISSDDDFIFLHSESFDKNISNLWKNDFKITAKFDFIGEQTDSTFHYALFNQFSRKNHVVLLKTSLRTGIRNQVEGNIPEGMQIITFRTVNQDCFLACTYKEKPIVIIFNSIDGKFKVLPNLLNRNAKFLSLNTDNQYFTVVLKKMGKGELLIQKYSNDGKLLKNIEIKEEKRHFNEAKIIDFNGKTLLVGTYSKGLQYRLEGFYIGLIDENFSTKKVQYHTFESFAEISNKNQKIMPYAITNLPKKIENGILGSVELFDANIVNQDYAGRIRYDKNLLFKIDESGNIAWNTTISLDGISKFIYAIRLPFGGNLPTKNELLESSVKPVSRLLIDNQVVTIAYQINNQIMTTSINHKTGKKLNTGFYQEKQNETIAGFLPWYGNNFLLWGKENGKPQAATNLYIRKIEVLNEKN